jgi:hypothetical protein
MDCINYTLFDNYHYHSTNYHYQPPYIGADDSDSSDSNDSGMIVKMIVTLNTK